MENWTWPLFWSVSLRCSSSATSPGLSSTAQSSSWWTRSSSARTTSCLQTGTFAWRVSITLSSSLTHPSTSLFTHQSGTASRRLFENWWRGMKTASYFSSITDYRNQHFRAREGSNIIKKRNTTLVNSLRKQVNIGVGNYFFKFFLGHPIRFCCLRNKPASRKRNFDDFYLKFWIFWIMKEIFVTLTTLKVVSCVVVFRINVK